MSQLLGSSFSKTFLEDVGKANHSLMIVSPYVTERAVNALVKKLKPKVKKRLLITIPPGPEYILGSVDLGALQKLQSIGFELRYIRDLHAKLYILDEQLLYMGSANFTTSGWELGKGNLEDMLKINLTKKEIDHIEARYIKTSKALILSKEWMKEIENKKEALNKQYNLAVKKIEDFIEELGPPSEENVFITYSRYHNAPNGILYYFKFKLAESRVRQIVKERMDFIFKLGGDPKQPDVTLKVPFRTIQRILGKEHKSNTTNDWQFRIAVDAKRRIHLISTLNDKAKNKYKNRNEDDIILDIKTKKGKFRDEK